MELLLIAVAIALARWAATRFNAEEEPASPTVPAAPVARMSRARRAPPEPRFAEDAPGSPPPLAAAPAARKVHAVAAVSPVPRSAHVREFRGVAALRRAVIAREVLGPPLSLRGR